MADQPRNMLLCVGPTGSGKTSLIDRLVSISTNTKSGAGGGVRELPSCVDDLPITAPTVGTNLTHIYPTSSSSKRTKSAVRDAVVVRELGGAMMPIWPNYFRECRSLMFVIDSSDARQVACTGVLLLTTLAHEELAGKPVVIVLNKSDLWRSVGAAAEFRWLLRLEDVVAHAPSPSVTVVDTSAKSGVGLLRLKQWLINSDNC